MRVITVRQPWAGSIMHHGKDVENRTRNIVGSYRGRIGIHVSLRHDYEAQNGPHDATLGFVDRHHTYGWGHIIGTVEIVGVHTDEECYDADIRRLANLYRSDPDTFRRLPDDGFGGIIGKARMCSRWAMCGHHHILLENPQPFAEPIPAKGRLGLWAFDTAEASA